jgi:hypothetical protein
VAEGAWRSARAIIWWAQALGHRQGRPRPDRHGRQGGCEIGWARGLLGHPNLSSAHWDMVTNNGELRGDGGFQRIHRPSAPAGEADLFCFAFIPSARMKKGME